jgi:hypothetical protein
MNREGSDKSGFDLRVRVEPYLNNCRVKETVLNKVFECLITHPTCEYYTYFGNAKFCRHPLNAEIANRTGEDNKTT